jgi:hypothetical protein
MCQTDGKSGPKEREKKIFGSLSMAAYSFQLTIGPIHFFPPLFKEGLGFSLPSHTE